MSGNGSGIASLNTEGITLGETNIYLWTEKEEGLWNPSLNLAQPSLEGGGPGRKGKEEE